MVNRRNCNGLRSVTGDPPWVSRKLARRRSGWPAFPAQRHRRAQPSLFVYRSGGHLACRRAGHPARRKGRVVREGACEFGSCRRAARCRPLRRPRWPPLHKHIRAVHAGLSASGIGGCKNLLAASSSQRAILRQGCTSLCQRGSREGFCAGGRLFLRWRTAVLPKFGTIQLPDFSILPGSRRKAPQLCRLLSGRTQQRGQTVR